VGESIRFAAILRLDGLPQLPNAMISEAIIAREYVEHAFYQKPTRQKKETEIERERE